MNPNEAPKARPTSPAVTTALDALPADARLVLEHLPCEPNGLSVHELADGLLEDRSPRARGRIRAALDCLEGRLAGVAVRRGDDDFGHADVELYGLQRESYREVRRMFDRGRGPYT